jgi:hypothetical protein
LLAKGEVVPPSKEVKNMNLQFLPVTGSLIPGMLILAMLAAVVVYGWWSDEHSHR